MHPYIQPLIKFYVTFSNHSKAKVRKVSMFTKSSLTTWLASFQLITSKQNIYQRFYGFKRSLPSDICFKISCVPFRTPLNRQMQRTVYKGLAEKRKLSSKYSKFSFFNLIGPSGVSVIQVPLKGLCNVRNELIWDCSDWKGVFQHAKWSQMTWFDGSCDNV